MDEKPRCRWFRFKLSTLLVLVAIAAWAMAQRPYVFEIERSPFLPRLVPAGSRVLRAAHMPASAVHYGVPLPFWKAPWIRCKLFVGRVNPRLRWPALALAAFAAWKGAGMTNQRRRRWFRFKLSTVFVLVGIAAWAMAMRPYVVESLARDVRVVGYNDSTVTISYLALRPNPRLKWPALALAAFIAWKGAWAVAGYRARRRAEGAPTKSEDFVHECSPHAVD